MVRSVYLAITVTLRACGVPVIGLFTQQKHQRSEMVTISDWAKLWWLLLHRAFSLSKEQDSEACCLCITKCTTLCFWAFLGLVTVGSRDLFSAKWGTPLASYHAVNRMVTAVEAQDPCEGQAVASRHSEYCSQPSQSCTAVLQGTSTSEASPEYRDLFSTKLSKCTTKSK